MKKLLKWFKKPLVRPRKIIDTLFIGTAFLIIIPIVILGLSLTWIFTSGFMKQTDRINTNTIDYVAELLGENLDSVYHAAYSMSNDKNILNYESFSGDNYEHAMLLKEINTVISRLLVQSDIVEEIYIFYKNSDIVVNNVHGTLGAKEILEEHYGMSIEELAPFLDQNNGRFVRCSLETASSPTDILYAKAIDKKFSKMGDIYAVFVLDGEFICNLMDMISLEDVGQSLLLDDTYNILLGDQQQYEKYEKQLKEMSGRNERDADINLPVLIQQVGVAKLNLCFVLDNSYYVTMIQFIWLVIIVIGIAVVVLTMLIAKYYIRRLYRPFGNIVNMFKPEEEEYEARSELEFFEEKYIEIKNMKEELGEYKNSQDVSLKEMFFHNFMKGFYKMDYQQYMQGLDIVFDSVYYTTILVKIHNFRTLVKNIKQTHYRSFVKDKLLMVMKDHNPERYGKSYYFYDGEHIGVIVCHDEKLDDMEEDITHIQRILMETLGITISVCIGDSVEEAEELTDEYRLLSDAMMQMRFCNPTTILTMQTYKKIGKYVDFSKYKNKVMQCVTERDYGTLEALIDQLFMNSNVFYTEVIQLVTGFLTVLSDLTDKKGNTVFCLSGSEVHPYDEIGRLGTVVEIAEYMKRLCKDVGDKLHAEEENKNEMYDKIMLYISENYMKEISLTLMAKEFGLSTSYFSRCFKEAVGKKYSEVVNTYRVKKAKELIDEEDTLKLFQVAELVGFTSYKAFAEAFKKYDGQSPESYKKSKNNQNFLEG